MHSKYRLHVFVYLKTSAFIILDDCRVSACGTYESLGYPRLPRVLLKRDAVLQVGRGCPLTTADRESVAQEDRKRSRPWKIDETVAFFCCASEVIYLFLDVPLRRKKKKKLESVGPLSTLLEVEGVNTVALLGSTSMPHSKTRHIQPSSGVTWSNLRGDDRKWNRVVNRTSKDWNQHNTAALPPLKHSTLLIFVLCLYFTSLCLFAFARKYHFEMLSKTFSEAHKKLIKCHQWINWKGRRTCNFEIKVIWNRIVVTIVWTIYIQFMFFIYILICLRENITVCPSSATSKPFAFEVHSLPLEVTVQQTKSRPCVGNPGSYKLAWFYLFQTP